MRPAHLLTRIASLTALLSISAQATSANQIHPRAGLWAINSQTALFGHVVPDVGAMIRMGPQRLQNHVDNMMRQNHVLISNDGTATVCVSKEQIDSRRYVNDYGSGCIVSKGYGSSNTLLFYIQCGAPKGSGDTSVRLIDSKHWEASTRLQLLVRGVSQDVENKSYGTWLSDTCPDGQ